MSDRTIRARCLLAMTLCLCLLCVGCAENTRDLPLSNRISNCEEVIAAIRQGLRDHAQTITISFHYGSDIFSELNSVVDAWVEEALKETDDPTEGDYIRYQYGGYTWNSACSLENGRWRYTVKIIPDYYCYLSQEERVTESVGELLRNFSFGTRTADGEKLWVIYDYLCRNVSYDKVHRKNPYYHLKSTAYAALVNHTATCQGYCAALYRLLRESGISCRIITGTAEGEEELHAWVIAEVNGLYYNLDPTWDAEEETYQYFLAGSADFAGHIPAEAFLTDEFTRRYPMAEESYALDGIE